MKNPVPRCNGLKRTLPLPVSDADCLALCEELRGNIWFAEDGWVDELEKELVP